MKSMKSMKSKNIKNLKIDIPPINSTILKWNIFKKATFIELKKEYENDKFVTPQFLKKELLSRWDDVKKQTFILNE